MVAISTPSSSPVSTRKPGPAPPGPASSGPGSPRAGTLGDSDGQAVGVGVIGEDEVRSEALGRGQGQVEDTRLFRVGERGGREVGVGPGLGGHQRRPVEARLFQELGQHRPAHPVHRRVQGAQPPRPGRAHHGEHGPAVGGQQCGFVDLYQEVAEGPFEGRAPGRAARDAAAAMAASWAG